MTWTLGVPWDITYQTLTGALIGATTFLVTIVILEWFGGNQ